MPEIYVYAVEGRTIDQKRALVKDITEPWCNFKVKPEAVMVRSWRARRVQGQGRLPVQRQAARLARIAATRAKRGVKATLRVARFDVPREPPRGAQQAAVVAAGADELHAHGQAVGFRAAAATRPGRPDRSRSGRTPGCRWRQGPWGNPEGAAGVRIVP